MESTPARGLIVTHHRPTATSLSRALRSDEAVTTCCAPSLAAARAVIAQGAFDIAVMEMEMPDGDALAMLRETGLADSADVFLMSAKVSKSAAMQALRLGVRDIFEGPMQAGEVAARIRAAAAARRRMRHEQRRYSRLRELSHRIVRDRREVRRRVEIVCKDLVGAYRELAEKFVAMNEERDEE